MRDIEQIRKDIEICDEELAKLLTRRMDCIEEIISYKKADVDSAAGAGDPSEEDARENPGGKSL